MENHLYPFPQVAITHGGVFHADEVFAFAFLRKINPNIKLKRVLEVSDEDSKDPNIVVFDIGGGEFDHHTKEAMEWRDPIHNLFPYASFGKVVRGYGDYIFDNSNIMNIFDNLIVSGIDMHDCGAKTSNGKPYHNDISMAINAINPTWLMQKRVEDEGNDSVILFDAFFMKAAELADMVIDGYIDKAIAIDMAVSVVDEAIQEKKKDENFIVLPFYVNYVSRVISVTDDVNWVIYPSKRGGWQIYSVVDHGKNRDLFSEKEIETLKNNPKCSFVHPIGFTAIFTDKESAIIYLKDR